MTGALERLLAYVDDEIRRHHTTPVFEEQRGYEQDGAINALDGVRDEIVAEIEDARRKAEQ